MNNGIFMNLGNFPFAGSTEMIGGAFAGPFQGAESLVGSSGEFTSLLDLVSDLQVADEQSGMMQKLVDHELEQMSLNDVLKTSTDLGMGAAGTGMLLSSLSVKPLSGSAEATLPSVLSSSSQSLKSSELLLGKSLNVLGDESLKGLSSESVRAWTLPALNGDLKDVVVGEKILTTSEQSVQHQKDKPALSVDMLGSDFYLKADKLSAEGSLLSRGKAEANSNLSNTLTKEFLVESNEAMSSIKRDIASAGFNEEMHHDFNPNQQEEALLKSESKSGLSKKPVSMSGADFLIHGFDTANDKNMSGADNSVVLKLPQHIGSSSDQRISSEAMSFVSQKVDDLKAIGGGQLTVKLDPVELGEVRIDVKRGDAGTVVTLTATRPETLALLTGSSSDLAKRLADQGATLEIKDGQMNRAKTEKLSLVDRPKTNFNEVGATHEFLSARDAKFSPQIDVRSSFSGLENRVAQEASRFNSNIAVTKTDSAIATLDSASQTSHQESASAFDSSSKREDARERWRQQFVDREIA